MLLRTIAESEIMGLNDILTLDNYDKIVDEIIDSKHFANRYDNIKPLFRELTRIVILGLQDEIHRINLSYNESYIGFYRVDSNIVPRLFITIRTRKSRKNETSYLHLSLKVESPKIREENKLDLRRRPKRRDEGDFDMKKLEDLNSRLEAIIYSYNSCIMN